jgi:hypothetical protein
MTPLADLILPNTPPEVTSFVATMGGQPVTEVPPGSTVDVTITATSPEHFPLSYKWTDSTGQSLPSNEATVQWHLPGTNSLNMVFVEVADGHGGVARRSLRIATEPAAQPRLSPDAAPAPAAPQPTPLLRAPIKFQHTGLFLDPDALTQCNGAVNTINGKQVTGCDGEAVAYYQALGAMDATGKPKAPFRTFGEWKASLGFADDPTHPAAGETRAVYYNNGDLQFGRDMHCRPNNLAPIDPAVVPAVGQFVVCYVANYSDATNKPGGDPQTAIFNAENAHQTIAAVAMFGVNAGPSLLGNQPPSWINIPVVSFLVFAPANPQQQPLPAADAFVLSTKAVLDDDGPKAVPGICMSCHNGSYNTGQHAVNGARFLPFDTASFLFDSKNAAFSRNAQAESFRTLNQLVRYIDTSGTAQFGTPAVNEFNSQTIRDLIDGWYSACGGVDTKGCKIDEDFHPFVPQATCAQDPSKPPFTCGWSVNFQTGYFYHVVPRVYCRTCHVANPSAFNWQSEQFAKQNPGAACGALNTHFMPFAEVPYNRFWNDAGAQSLLGQFLGCTLKPPLKQ